MTHRQMAKLVCFWFFVCKCQVHIQSFILHLHVESEQLYTELLFSVLFDKNQYHSPYISLLHNGT